MPANQHNGGGFLTYKEMRCVAQEIFKYEQRMRRIRTSAMIGGSILLIFVVLLGGGVVIFGMVADTEVREDGRQSALVKRDSNRVIATSESTEDFDGSDLVDYQRNGVDANGDPDGEWILNDSRVAMIKTISWKEGEVGNETTIVHHVADITRYDGQNTSVDITTKVGHKIIIWDSDGVDRFDVMIRRWNVDMQDWETNDYQEVVPDGDEDDLGRGRVVVSVDRPRLDPAPRPVALDNYF
uniref:Uncharacterized protein n=1 Tax=Alexandrium andersonii TaxID=327968 RepID=A0A7S2DAA1_9DINO|mmetsp:Transcript_50135/g.113540  ORF Transcript_50135/g.113540 Transcript_50135/m.113540 type:complete len:240 (+) Transcript_50135:115-834(+)